MLASLFYYINRRSISSGSLAPGRFGHGVRSAGGHTPARRRSRASRTVHLAGWTVRAKSGVAGVFHLCRWGAVAVVLISGSAHMAIAQSHGEVLGTPDSLVLSDATPMTTFTMTNSDTVAQEAWLAPDCGEDSNRVVLVDPLSATWRNEYPCAVLWLSGFPQHVMLQPHERRTIRIRMIPYPTLPDGRYTARLILALPPKSITVPFFGSGFVITHNNIRVIYQKGPTSPRSARARWSATVPVKRNILPLRHMPDVLIVDDRKTATTFTLDNPGATPREIWLALDCPWFRSDIFRHQLHWSGFYELAWHHVVPNAVLWLSGFPQHIVLAPHEKRSIPIQVIPYPDLPAGSYYARVVMVESPVLAVTAGGDTAFTTPSGVINLVYHRGAEVSLPGLTDLKIVRPPSGSTQACVVLHQRGIGWVTALHVEVNDASEHRVKGSSPVNRGHPPKWMRDTTVEGVRGDEPIPDAPAIGPPAPVCLTLPGLPHGHYRLIVTAYALEDTGRHQPARETLLFVRNSLASASQ
jgi:hypothetical protein